MNFKEIELKKKKIIILVESSKAWTSKKLYWILLEAVGKDFESEWKIKESDSNRG